ncbi:E3 ubiquitin-protein ligase TRIM56-like [Babylonia areolata]|uniref:E3 ubiquitin-protein ligase TRIM56-like n=1 Tax=Babylonia areolata TaxID=304850 RepID=UPI003FCF82A4
MSTTSLRESMSLFLELDIDDLKYECLICLDLLFKPKILQCDGCHTFCEKCLQKYIDQHSVIDPRDASGAKFFYCPACKGRVMVPRAGAAGFQTNYYISDVVEKLRRVRAHVKKGCDICSRSEGAAAEDGGLKCTPKACFLCSDCSNALCKTCVQDHSTHFPSHVVQPISDASVEDSAIDPAAATTVNAGPADDTELRVSSCNARSRRTKCSIHPSEDLRFYCRGKETGEACDTVICRDCRMTDHFHHPVVTDLSIVVQESSRQLLQHKEEIQSRIQTLTAQQSALEARRKAVVSSRDQVETLLEARTSDLIAAITDLRDQKLALLRAMAGEEEGRVDEEVSLTEGKRSSLQDLLGKVQRASGAGSDVDMVRLCTDVTRLLGEEERGGKGDRVVRGEGGAKGEDGGTTTTTTSTTRGFLLKNGTIPTVPTELLDKFMGTIVQL